MIIRSLMGETSAEEERQLIRWRAADASNDAYYHSLAATWELVGPALQPPEREPPPVRRILEMAGRQEGGAGPAAGGRPGAGGRRRGTLIRWLAVAAVVAGALIAAPLLRQTVAPSPAVTGDRAMASDVPLTVRLGDGSTAHLAAGSVLEFHPGDARRVRLTGRAYFGIAHNPDRPFIVDTDFGVTRVLGTRFDLTAREGRLTAVVVEGRVEVSSEAGTVEIGPGEQTRMVPGRTPVVRRADVAATTGWLGPVLIFQDTPLTTVGREIEERFGRTVVIDDPALARRTVTAVFSHHSLEEILPALCRAVDARCVATPDTVRLIDDAHP
jgi:ferric-dicitrate binding protein FerR (iron transport regulator)